MPDPERVEEMRPEFDPFRVAQLISRVIRWRCHRLINSSATRTSGATRTSVAARTSVTAQTSVAAHRILLAIFLLTASLPTFPTHAQDARELQQERAASNKIKGDHPLLELMRTRKSSLRP